MILGHFAVATISPWYTRWPLIRGEASIRRRLCEAEESDLGHRPVVTPEPVVSEARVTVGGGGARKSGGLAEPSGAGAAVYRLRAPARRCPRGLALRSFCVRRIAQSRMGERRLT